MDKISIAIVEDEPIIAKDLAYMLQDLNYNIAGICHTPEEALLLAKKSSPDIFILDINLGSHMDGIEIAKILKQHHEIPFIYLTSYADQSTIDRAKATYPLAYLIKPIDEKDLISTIEIAVNNFNSSSFQNHVSGPLSDIIFIREKIHHKKINISDIIYVEAQDNYSLVITSEGKFLLSHTLKVVAEKLEVHGFLRIHRSYVINPIQIVKLEDGYVHLPTGSLPISKSYKSSFMSKFSFL